MKKRIGIIAAVVAILLVAVVLLIPHMGRLTPWTLNQEKPLHAVTGAAEDFLASENTDYPILAAENEKFQLLCREDGKFCVVNKETGTAYASNPLETDKKAQGINKTNMNSQLYITYANSGGNTQVKNSTVDCVNKKWLTWAPIENGIRYTYDFQKAGIVIPVEYVLEEDGLRASIVVDEIVEGTLGYYLTEVSLLPYFAATLAGSDGYFLVPDGSGALIYHDNEKGTYGAYKQAIYSRDAAMIVESLTVQDQAARLPVFGMKSNDYGYLAVVDAGDGVATVNAMTSGNITSYNNAYVSFRFRLYTMLTYSRSVDTQQVLMLSSVQPKNVDYSVKYILLEEEGLDYVDMAAAYRDHLIKEQGLTARVEADYAPFYVEMLGSIKKDTVVLGLKLKLLQRLTTFDQAQKILSQMQQGGMDDLLVRYTGWQPGGMESALNTQVKFEKSLGGAKDYAKLVDYANANGIELFMDFDLLNLYESGNGVSSFMDATQTIQHTPTYLYSYDYNTLEKEPSTRWQLVTPKMAAAALEETLSNTEKLRGSHVSLSSMGDTLYSDFTNKESGLDRSNTRLLWEDMLRLADRETEKLLVDGGNGYALPHVSHVYNAPMKCTFYDIEDEDVPFYQIVLHGFVSYSTEPMNLSSNPQNLVLKAVETGSSLSACLMYAENHVLTDTNLEYVFSGNYETWMDMLCESYERVTPVLREVAQATIVGHECLLKDVYKTQYSNGSVVYVNYSSKDVQADGYTIPAKDFIHIGGKGEQ